MVFLSGATGFLGSYILMELLRSHDRVRALRRPGTSLAGAENIFRAFNYDVRSLHDRIDWVEGDVLDLYSLEEAMIGVDTVIHAAGLIAWEKRDKNRLFAVNRDGTANVVNVALSAGVKKLIYISSVAALGGGPEIVDDREVSWKSKGFMTVYGKSKYAGEREVLRGMEEGLQVCLLEPAVILGFDEPSRGSAKLFSAIYDGLKYYSPGCFGFVGVRDVARAAALLADQVLPSEAPKDAERYILSEGNYEYGNVFSMIASGLGKKPPSRRAGKYLLQLAWRMEWIRSRLSGRKAVLSRETALVSGMEFRFDGSKITEKTDFVYTPLSDTIKETGELILPLLVNKI